MPGTPGHPGAVQEGSFAGETQMTAIPPRFTADSPPIIEIIAVTYRQPGPLQVFLQCLLNQTAGNWRLLAVHDGPDEEFESMMRSFAARADDRMRWRHTAERHNDYGHSLRKDGLGTVSGDYVLLTNGDNYYVPVFIEEVTAAILRGDPDVVMWDMVHSHRSPGGRWMPRYSHFQTEYRRRSIDMGAAVVRAELACAAGFRDTGFAGDATYFEDVAAAKDGPLDIAKLKQVLFVHN